MKRLIIGLVFINTLALAQRQEQKDSLVSEICKAIVALDGEPDSIRVAEAYNMHLYPFLNRFPENQRNEIGTGIYYRLQRNCNEFSAILIRAQPPNENWESIAEKPVTKLRKRTCRKLLDHGSYFYLESYGDTVQVEITDKFWVDKFKDGTFSKLEFQWIDDCEFDLTFIESNNEIRKNFSKPGDKYLYQVIEKNSGYYNMSVEIPGTNKYLLFKLHYSH